ncbi:hypothetical protein [Streptomyces kanamyceticus]|uniref:hypothetical protein n=1 Tax=Streptomyces kanamyceticus TaxID=1967 RepID=UPI0006E43375|nr:hypothetical protein [Streptomyces kanamyceticus]
MLLLEGQGVQPITILREEYPDSGGGLGLVAEQVRDRVELRCAVWVPAVPLYPLRHVHRPRFLLESLGFSDVLACPGQFLDQELP